MTPPFLRCRRCGGELVPLGDMAASVADAGVLALRASCALEARRLALPDVATFGLRDLARDLPRLAERLRCHAGTCAAGLLLPYQQPPGGAP